MEFILAIIFVKRSIHKIFYDHLNGLFLFRDPGYTPVQFSVTFDVVEPEFYTYVLGDLSKLYECVPEIVFVHIIYSQSV